MNLSLRNAGITVALTTSLALTACGDDGNDDVAAFCQAGQAIEAATAATDSPDAAVAAFGGLSGTIDELVDAAPDAVAGDAEAFRGHFDAALEDGDFTAFEDGTVDELTARMAAACAEG